ncbi:VanZ family protein [Haloarcula nitratireducens]|uniref:VanZ family protein n=1 Tax=Haloarcula nitratireducens TaxID=2487749 RepID=A0AAW4PAP8_9EURY|nr:VanZ family protein [Halomicroarcula nitratireducens]MBX0294969.1 VanZ family protein [Halomicroarcula nitratireducens]
MTVRLPLLPRWLRWSVVALVGGFIFYTSIVTAPPETPIDYARLWVDIALDKWRHFVAYAVLAGTLAYATDDWSLERRGIVLAVVSVTVLYGVGIEVGQSFLPGRYFSLGDALANAVGALLVAPWYLLRRYVTFVGVRSWLRLFAPHSGR